LKIAVIIILIVLFGFRSDIYSTNYIVDVWWIKYNDKTIRAWDVLDTAKYNIETKKIAATDTIRFMYSSDAIFQADHTTQIFLFSKGRRVLVSSKFSDIYPDGEGQFAASRVKQISDSLKDRNLEVHVFVDTPYVKPWIVATLRLK
jgi:hypothetical protein